MEDLSGYTSTELLKMFNEVTDKHSKLKEEILNLVTELESLEKTVNDKIELLGIYERKYIKLIEEINNR